MFALAKVSVVLAKVPGSDVKIASFVTKSGCLRHAESCVVAIKFFSTSVVNARLVAYAPVVLASRSRSSGTAGCSRSSSGVEAAPAATFAEVVARPKVGMAGQQPPSGHPPPRGSGLGVAGQGRSARLAAPGGVPPLRPPLAGHPAQGAPRPAAAAAPFVRPVGGAAPPHNVAAPVAGTVLPSRPFFPQPTGHLHVGGSCRRGRRCLRRWQCLKRKLRTPPGSIRARRRRQRRL